MLYRKVLDLDKIKNVLLLVLFNGKIKKIIYVLDVCLILVIIPLSHIISLQLRYSAMRSKIKLSILILFILIIWMKFLQLWKYLTINCWWEVEKD